MDEFAAEVADLAKRFLLRNQYEVIDFLGLTGGGLNIPTVRDEVCQESSPSHPRRDSFTGRPGRCLARAVLSPRHNTCARCNGDRRG